ncbi:MAG: triphosphoribosyl-dephospho-CoA synthase [Planctomycetales bacterium]|nr:triphosphoribosyl-dephospho-CoA synthase [Planctomycetales bacterium]
MKTSCFPLNQSWPLETAAQLACLLESSAAKLGNVHPQAAFSDMHFGHFAASSLIIGRCLAESREPTVGTSVLAAVSAIKQAVSRNTYLGTILLLVPLARALSDQSITSVHELSNSVRNVLGQLTAQDSHDIYRAIASASPGGLGNRASMDVLGDAPEDILQAMAQVASFDAVARQYINGFADVLGILHPWLIEELQRFDEPLAAICRLQLRWLAHEPDGLIVRKAGKQIAQQVQQLASEALSSNEGAHATSLAKLDRFLRADGHRRNPGTTADLIAATLFVQLTLAQPQ